MHCVHGVLVSLWCHGCGLRTVFAPEAKHPLKNWFRASGLDLSYVDLALVLLESLEQLCLGL